MSQKPEENFEATDAQQFDPYATNVSDSALPFDSLGRYRIRGELGRGGMGVVYRADKTGDSHSVALKTLQVSSADALARIKSEFRVIADLAHTNLVRLGELVTTDTVPFFTMEIVQGVSFSDFVQSGVESQAVTPTQPFHETRLRSALRQIADGLTALHQAGVIHRDIKPSNVLVTEEGRVVILDMGLALEASSNASGESVHERAGTPYYMAPEQMRGEELTAASDWFPVGIMLYETLSGEKLFHSRDLRRLLAEKEMPERKPPSAIASNVPSDLNDLCLQLLHPDPSKRPSDKEILNRLDANRPVSVDTLSYIGRDEEFDSICQQWQAVKQGESRVVLVSGVSGIGKTSLVEGFLKRLRQEQPVVIFRGRCYENETVAYRGFDSIVDSLASYLRRLPSSDVDRVLPLNAELLCQLFPVFDVVMHRSHQTRSTQPPRGDVRELKHKGIMALRELLCRLCRFVSVVIFLDDLQQGDEETATIFRGLFDGDDPPNLLFLATFRQEDAEINPCLNRIRQSQLPDDERGNLSQQLEIVIDRLNANESRELIAELLKGYPHRREDFYWIVDEAQGDPLFIRMLVEHILSDKTEEDGGNGDRTGWTLSSVIESRVNQLDKKEVECLEYLVAAGKPVYVEDLVAVLKHDEVQSGLLRGLRLKRFIRKLGDLQRIEVFHDQIRECVFRLTPPDRVASVCLSLARQMDERAGNREVETLADLYRRGGDRLKAGSCYVEAAENAASTFAFRLAVECYQYSLSLLQPHGSQEVRLRIGLADALANASRSVEAGREYLKAASLVEGDESLRLRQQAALKLLTSGYIDEGVEVQFGLLRHYHLPIPESRVGTIWGLIRRNAALSWRGFRPLAKNRRSSSNAIDVAKTEACWSAAAGLSLVDPLRGALYMAETVQRSLQLGIDSTVPRDLAAYMGHVSIGGSRSRRIASRVLRANREIAMQRREPYSLAMLSLSRGISALLRGEWSAALRSCDGAIDYLSDASCHGATWELATSQTVAMWSLQYQGRLPELGKRQPDLWRQAKEANDVFAILNFGTQVRTHLELAIDDAAAAHSWLDEDESLLWKDRFFVQHHNYLLARTYALLYEGKAEKAFQLIDGQWRFYRQECLSHVQQVRIDHQQVLLRASLAAAETGYQRERLLTQARKLIRSLRNEKSPWGSALACAYESGWAELNGNRVQAKVLMKSACEQLRIVRMGLFVAAAEEYLCRLEKQESNDAADRWNRLGVVNGPRMASMLIPGFTSLG